MLNETKMHGNVFTKIDELRALLRSAVKRRNVVIDYNRLYLSTETVSLNISVKEVMLLITVYDNDFEVSHLDKKTSKTQKHRVSYRQIEDGSFIDLFIK
jgi:hypothetical protein